MPDSFTLTLPARPEAPTRARREVAGRLGDRLNGRLGDVELMLSELVTNAVKHGAAAADDEVRVEVESEPGLVRVIVSDPGTGFRFTPRAPGDDTTAGWGLYLVDRLADRWGAGREQGRTRVWFEIDA